MMRMIVASPQLDRKIDAAVSPPSILDPEAELVPVVHSWVIALRQPLCSLAAYLGQVEDRHTHERVGAELLGHNPQLELVLLVAVEFQWDKKCERVVRRRLQTSATHVGEVGSRLRVRKVAAVRLADEEL